MIAVIRSRGYASDAITLLKIYSDANWEYQITYYYDEGGPGHDVTWVCIYQMGEREIGRGEPARNKQEAKKLAAVKALDRLRREGHRF